MMMNALSQVSKDTDIGKQMAYMRNYINQLRDEIENDLMNIGYNNLDADLRRRLDDMQTGYSRTEAMTTEVAGLLKTQYLTAQEIITNYITAREASLTYATIGSLNAVSAEIGDLAAIAITTQNLSAQSINANQITAGKIKANQLDSSDISTNAFSSQTINCWGIQVYHIIGTNGSSMLIGDIELDNTIRFYNSSGSAYVELDYQKVKTILESI